MKKDAWITLAWSLVVLILWQIVLNGREPLVFVAGSGYDLRCEGWASWQWTTPSHLNIENKLVRNGLDGTFVGSVLTLLCLFGWLIFKTPRELSGLKLDQIALKWLACLGLIFGLIGMLLVWSSGPWQIRPAAYRLSTEEMMWIYLHVVLIGPLFEEILFRGGLQGSLSHLCGKSAGAIIPAVIFMGLHGLSMPGHVAVIFMGTAGMTFLRWKTDSLPVCIVLHVAGNAFMISHSLWLLKA